MIMNDDDEEEDEEEQKDDDDDDDNDDEKEEVEPCKEGSRSSWSYQAAQKSKKDGC